MDRDQSPQSASFADPTVTAGAAADVAASMLLAKPFRLTATVVGIAAAFFLSASQIGLFLGWIDTITAIVRHAEVDLWVVPPHTPSFDYGTAIPRSAVYRTRSVPGVAWAEGMFVDWNHWQSPRGKRVNVQIIGLDDSLVGGPWAMAEGDVEAIQRRDSVIIDKLYLNMLGVERVGEEVELLGGRAEVRGISSGIRTFTAAPFVFTSIESAINYDQRYRHDQVTYVMARCAPGSDVREVHAALQAALPELEVLTTRQFANRSAAYWMLETGLGLTIGLTATLGIFVGVIVVSQTLYTTTQDHQADYVLLKAIGVGTPHLLTTILVQAIVVTALGVSLGAAAFVVGATLSSETPVPLLLNKPCALALIAIFLASGVAAAIASVRLVFRADPATIFHA